MTRVGKAKVVTMFLCNPFYWLERLCAISDYIKATRSQPITIIWLIALWSAFRKIGPERQSIVPIYGLFLAPMMPQRTAHCKVCFSDDNVFLKVVQTLKYSLTERYEVILFFLLLGGSSSECWFALQLSSFRLSIFWHLPWI